MRHFFLFFFLLIFACNANTDRTNSKNTPSTMQSKEIDWQGHRGARGLLPENTIPAFLKALEYPKVKTLELDVAISKDRQVIITHEPWMSEHICTKPDGQFVSEAEAKTLKIYEMSYAEIKTYDCGLRGNARFPDQKAIATHKPSLKDMVKAADAKAKELERPLPFYDIEIKSQADYYGIFTPAPTDFVALILAELKELDLLERVTLQSFDLNILEAIHQQQAGIVTAQLVENTDSFQDNLQRLSFKPTIYSPYFEVINQQMVDEVHAQGMRLVPWTVNEVTDMRRLLFLGVDGIITDYPNRIEEAL